MPSSLLPAPRIAVYPGTFDPVTLGHLDVIRRAGRIFDRVIVAVTDNPSKKPLFPVAERVKMLESSCRTLSFVEVQPFSGLLVDFLKEKKCKTVLRGLRELSDFQFEFQQAIINRKLDPEVDTVFIVTSAQYFYLSSSAVKEIARLGGNLKDFVPPEVGKALSQKLAKPRP